MKTVALVLKFVKKPKKKKGIPLQDLKRVSKVILLTENKLKGVENTSPKRQHWM